MKPWNRREFLFGSLACGLLSGCAGVGWRPPEKGPIVCVFPSPADDHLKAIQHGLLRLRDELGMDVEYRESADATGILDNLREAAASSATLVMGYGDQAAAALSRTADEFPQQRFAAIQSGATPGPNLAVYSLAEEEAAWLAGAAAALHTRSKLIGHIGTPRGPRSALLQRAFVAGAAAANPEARISSRIVDPAENRLLDAARTMFEARVDVLYAAVDTPPESFIDACARRPLPLIGHAQDWTRAQPKVFIASAVADPGAAIYQAGRDLHDAVWIGNTSRDLGVDVPEAVRLSLAPGLSESMREQLDLYRKQIVAGSIRMPGEAPGKS